MLHKTTVTVYANWLSRPNWATSCSLQSHKYRPILSLMMQYYESVQVETLSSYMLQHLGKQRCAEVADAGKIGFGIRMQNHARFFERTRTDAVTRTQNRLSFICERARKVAKNSLMIKINRLEKKTNDPTKIRLGPQVKKYSTRPQTLKST